MGSIHQFKYNVKVLTLIISIDTCNRIGREQDLCMPKVCSPYVLDKRIMRKKP